MTLSASKRASAAGSFVFGLLLAAITLLCVAPLVQSNHGYTVGARAPRTLEAVHSAQYESQALTAEARNRAAADVVPIPLPQNPAIKEQQSTALNAFFERVRELRGRSGLSVQQQIAEIGAIPGGEEMTVSARSGLLALDNRAFEDLRSRAQTALQAILDAGVREPFQASSTPTTTTTSNSESSLINEYLDSSGNAPGSAGERALLTEVLLSFVIPNVATDAAATRDAQQRARDNVAPVVVTHTKGQTIVTEGQILSLADIEALRATGLLDDQFDYEDFGGSILFALLIGSVAGFGVHRLRPFPDPSARRSAVVLVAFAGAMLMVRVFFPLTDPDSEQRYLAFALPVAAAAIIAAALGELAFGLLIAWLLGIAGAYCVATIPEIAGSEFNSPLEPLELALAYSAAGTAGAFAVYQAERMSRFAVCAIVVSLATLLPLVTFWLLDVNRDTADLPWLGLGAGLSGVSSAVIGAGFFTVIPAAFGIPTRLQLFELADTGHPLMRRLREEAPGTYHHSMMVGALAERAADTIGADALLAKVGAYCHDIGKLAAADHFIENMLDGTPSPHDSLPPEESARIIRNHVDAGLELARKYRLPPPVRAFIPEHHGTRLVTYFYRKAVTDQEDAAGVDVAPYRYNGPRPRSRETAIVMLADSCEALARSRTNRDAASLSELVDSVFAERLAEGQLDECDITMRDLQAVAQSFKDTLRAIYHPRIEYPQATPEEMIAIATGGT